MTIVVTKRADFVSPSITESSKISLRYIVKGTNNESDAREALIQEASLSYSGLIPTEYKLEWQGPEIWYGEVTYGLREGSALPGESGFGGPEDDTGGWTFETSGITEHITKSKETRNRYPISTDEFAAPDLGGIIGFDKGEVQGIDIKVPIFKWTEVYSLPDSLVTDSYKAQLHDLTGKVNNNNFRMFQAGEVLFEGARGSKSKGENWRITYSFAGQANSIQEVTLYPAANVATAISVNIDKRGWEYVWFKYNDKEVTHKDAGVDVKSLVKLPAWAYVEKIYDYANFALLGI